MFEITRDDIALLNDEDLRSLVGRLSEAELRRRGFSSSYVTWGGNQTAKDGGLDVRVALPADSVIDGFVPRPATGFQVKRQDMPRGEIEAEMRPQGMLRQVIRELADNSGAYVIVSSIGSTSDLALRNRHDAMKAAVRDLQSTGSLTLDFYDSSRIATWVRENPGVIAWVREKIGKPISGWQSYGPWAYAPDGPNGEYLLDEKLRVHNGTNKPPEEGLRALEAIQQLRDRLRDPGKVVRLVGLSGVGKTRLVQALFDQRIGENNLDPSLACYTNMTDDPAPQPRAVVSDLIASCTRAVVVVDNCPADLHSRLTEVCRSPASTVSLVTVEYDIQDDQPEGTEVFALDPSSNELVERLINHRFPEISRVDAQTIAEFSSGNARIAIALAGTIGKNENISGLTDGELFQRLFQQRKGQDKSLLLAAEACSLVYSFDGADVSNSDQAELRRLGATIGRTPEDIFQRVADLRRRDLVQRRGIWRAVLPPAIANRLASTALEDIPPETIERNLIEGAPERLVKSFSRRLGYLHKCKEAAAIVDMWLKPGGRLGNVTDLNPLGKAIFNNIAPVSPEGALAALERGFLEPGNDSDVRGCFDYVHLIRSIAYEGRFFKRCTTLLSKCLEAADGGRESDHVRRVFVSLFSLGLSGTHATVEQRLEVVESFLLSENGSLRRIGLEAFKTLLQVRDFISSYGFEFGGWSRDYGYWPGNRDEAKRWFRSVLNLGERLACSDQPIASSLRVALARKIRGLWTDLGMYDEVEHACHALVGRQFWGEGWIATREILKFDSERFGPVILARLSSLEESLRPKDLVEKVKAIVQTNDTARFYELDDENPDGSQSGRERTTSMVRTLGNQVAADTKVFNELLADLVIGDSGHLYAFGYGLMESAADRKAIWERLVTQMASVSEGNRNIQILLGALNAMATREPGLTEILLDAAVEDEMLGPWYPRFQTAVRIDKKGADRLKRSLEVGRAPVEEYQYLALGRVTDNISGTDLKELILAIAQKLGGFNVGLQVLSMRLHSDGMAKRSHPAEVVDAGRRLLSQLTFSKVGASEDYELGSVVETCLTGEGHATEIASDICVKIKESVSKYETNSHNIHYLLKGLLATQPIAVLNILLSGDKNEIQRGIRTIGNASRENRSLLDSVTGAQLFIWCDSEPESRYAIAASVITLAVGEETGTSQWSKIALDLLKKAPNPLAVLERFVGRVFRPGSWMGSLATKMSSNLHLLDELEGPFDPAVDEFLAKEKVRIREEIEAERRREELEDKNRDERFE